MAGPLSVQGEGHDILGQALGEGQEISFPSLGEGHIIFNAQFTISNPPPPC